MKQTIRRIIFTKSTALAVAIFCSFFLFAQPTLAATYSVTNTNDSGAGSFRQAITDANSNAGPDQIDFNIPGAGPHTITPSSNLPNITDTVVINGLSQPGSNCDGVNTEIMIRLDSGGSQQGLALASSAGMSEVNGLALANSSQNGQILYVAAEASTIRCNFIGTFDGFTTASTVPNSDYVFIDADNVTIGGLAETDRNVSLANIAQGAIFINSASISGLTIANNYIGVGVDGSSSAGLLEGNAIWFFRTDASDILITENVIVSRSSSVLFNNTEANTQDSIEISNNKMGVDATGNNAPDNTGNAVTLLSGLISQLSITDNVLVSRVSGARTINSPTGDRNGVLISENRINISGDGTTSFSQTSGNGNTGIYAAESELSTIDHWDINQNQIHGSGSGISILGLNGAEVWGNTIGYNIDRSACFADSATAVSVSGSDNVVIGGTTQVSANYICAISNTSGVYFSGQAGVNDTSILGNSITAGGSAIQDNTTTALQRPIVKAFRDNGNGTAEVTFTVNAPAGNYRVEIFNNNELVNSENYPQAQFFMDSTDVSSAGTGVEQFTATISSSGLIYPSGTITKIDESSPSGFGMTSAVGEAILKSDLSIETTDGVDEVEEQTNPHTITQTITNTGPSAITDIVFDLETSTCINLSEITTSGSATNAGTYEAYGESGYYTPGEYNWTGLLEPNQSLVISMIGPVTCLSGNNAVVNLTHSISSAENNTLSILDLTTTGSSWETTAIVGLESDIEFVTTDNVDSILTGTTGHQLTQTITNNGPSSITDMVFDTGSSCLQINGYAVSGTATDTGVYSDDSWDGLAEPWSGLLEPNQNLVFTWYVDIDCGEGSSTNLSHTPTSIQNTGSNVTDTSGENGFSDTTSIIAPVSDFSITKTLNNPQDLAEGAELDYTITLTNNGPEPMDISQYDGQFDGFGGFAVLFYDFIPPELTFTSYSSNDDIECIGGAGESFPAPVGQPLGPGSLANLGPAMANHSDHEAVLCNESTGVENILGNGESISATLTLTVTSPDLDFTNYAYGAFGQNDPTGAAFAEGGYDGSTDLIDFIQGYDGVFNNFAESLPVSDLSIQKELVEPFAGNQPGQTVSYDITVSNAGPMAFDLDLTNLAGGGNIFSDIYPASDLTFVDSDDTDILCLDLGPGSSAYLGVAGEDHPNHQLLTCGYSDSGLSLASGESRTVRLNFIVNNEPAASFTNYAAQAVLPTDLDAVALQAALGTATGDILDTIDNENFAKVTYVDENAVDDDNDGVPNVSEGAGPNNGDANNDGIVDSEQAYVVNFTNSVTANPVALAVPADCTIASVSTNAEDGNSGADPEFAYPLGFLGFTIDCADPGYTAVITAYFFDAIDDSYTLRKYHSNNDTYTTINEASISQTTIGGSPVMTTTYQVTDGGALDVDGVEDGSITDPIGFGVQPEATGGVLSSTGRSVVLFASTSVILIVTATGALWAKRYIANSPGR